MTINERIRYLRKELLNISQANFADKIKLKQNTVSVIEKEGAGVTEQNIELICATFHVSRDWLVSGNGNPFLEDGQEDEYVRATAEIDISDPKARRAIVDYWHLSEEDKKLFWNFIEKFIKKEQED